MGPLIPAILAAIAAWRCSGPYEIEEDPIMADTKTGGKDAGVGPWSDVPDAASYADSRQGEPPNTVDGHPPDVISADLFAKDFADSLWDAKEGTQVVAPDVQNDTQPDIKSDVPIDAPVTPKFCESKMTLPASCNVVSIAAGQTSSFVAIKDGTVRGWGKVSHLSGGKMEDLFSSATPTQVAGFQNISQVSIRLQHLLARDIYGGVWAMGQNAWGQLGNGKSLKISGIGEIIDAATPIAVPNLTDIMDVAAGDFHSLALNTSGKLYAWGYNGKGQLGLQDPKAPDAPVPSEVAQPTAVLFKQPDVVTRMGAGHLHSYAVQQSGAALTWGDNLQNELGIDSKGKSVLGPTFIDKGFLRLAGGYSFTCFMTIGCGFSCKGDGAPPEGATKTLSGVADIIAGAGNLIVILQSGDAHVWGDNSSGQAGTGSANAAINIPTPVTGLGKIMMASVGTDHICLVTAGCDVYCAGANQAGQLGNGSTTPSSTWVKVNGLK